MRYIYIVLPTSGVGGAERRFVDIFIGLVDRGFPVRMVIPSFLYGPLFSQVGESYLDSIVLVEMKKWSPLFFLFKFSLFFFKKINSKDHVHYVLNPIFFLHLLKNSTYSISFCHSSMMPKFNTSSRGLLIQRLAVKWARKIDILNESVFEKFVATLPQYTSKAKVTPGGSYIRMPRFNNREERNNFIFISRLVEGKGVDVFLKLVPKIDEYIKNKIHYSFPFVIYGVGPLEDSVKNSIRQIAASGINISYGGFVNAGEIFPEAKCVFSLQQATNYPSRVIAEALVYGCNVVVSDTGDTRNFGKRTGLYYFSNNEALFKALDMVLLGSIRHDDISKEAYGKFSAESYLDYYCDVLGG